MSLERDIIYANDLILDVESALRKLERVKGSMADKLESIRGWDFWDEVLRKLA